MADKNPYDVEACRSEFLAYRAGVNDAQPRVADPSFGHYAVPKEPPPQTPDPWKHRSQGMRCKTCMWFVAKEPTPATQSHPGQYDLGRCRKHAPTMGGFPAVFVNDWCGDHRIDENKV